MKILCVHSFAVHGTASMKAMMSILGTRILPVPSLYLSGLTNIPGFVKTDTAFEELFYSSLDIAKRRNERLILYVGYLGNAQQSEIILQGLKEYEDIIENVLIDPVSGDHGKLYVPQEVLDAWPRLLEKADWAFPNYTELCLLTGKPEHELDSSQEALNCFQERFSNLSFIATSLPAENQIKLGLMHEEEMMLFQHKRLDAHYGGTGDVFAAFFLFFAFLRKMPHGKAMEKAAMETLRIIEQSQAAQSPDLLIFPEV
ncbi:MAG: bifunctional hydroxymethylpyrimidine kinase/phosphomethylpyrimidine kinase [Bacteroidia bacterium]|nr:bifunctional hydroxymethylpyrimidine kinase/phosphomethylpyrimidine kinase [Bacteroidia bacterium]